MKIWPRLALLSLACLAIVLAPGLASLATFAGEKHEVKLELLKWSEFQQRLASPKPAKYTLVDAWATTCAPCKENFPHLVEMHRKYGPKGLAVISLSMDDPTDTKAVAAAKAFLEEKKAAFTNVLLNEDYGDGFDKLRISAIPAVFLFGPDGKEVKRFTMDDPNNQFTYEQVDKELAALFQTAGSASARN